MRRFWVVCGALAVSAGQPSLATAQTSTNPTFGLFYQDAVRIRPCVGQFAQCNRLVLATGVMSFVSGIGFSMAIACQLAKAEKEIRPDMFAVSAAGGTSEELIDAVISYGTAHPDAASLSPGEGVMAALGVNRPCVLKK